MRWTLARLAAAVTTMIAIAFVVPLALVTQQIAEDRALADARGQAASVVTALAVSHSPGAVRTAVAATDAGAAGRLTVVLTEALIGEQMAPDADVQLARTGGRVVTADVPGGTVLLQPVALGLDGIAVIEVFVPTADLNRGVRTAWLTMIGLAVLLVAGSVLVADRLGTRLVDSARRLATTAAAFGSGDLTARVTPSGPPELEAAGWAFNTMADRVIAYVDAERELAADLSHRLRTPLTALRLDIEHLPSGPVGNRIRDAVNALEDEVDSIILSARRGTRERAEEHTDVVEVLADRMAFWAVLADDHGRAWQVVGGDTPLAVRVPRADLIAAVDALLGNVFEHTPQGTGFRLTVTSTALYVDDAGPGIADLSSLRRGVSGSGSTGLGLSIAHRVATSVGGRLDIGRGPLGGARVGMVFA